MSGGGNCSDPNDAFGLGVAFFGVYSSDIPVSFIPRHRVQPAHILNGSVSYVCYELQHSTFAGYSSIAICVLRFQVRQPLVLEQILRSIESNDSLRYKSKLIFFSYAEDTFLWVDIEQSWRNLLHQLKRAKNESNSEKDCGACCVNANIKKFDPEIYDYYSHEPDEHRWNAYQRYLVKRDYEYFQTYPSSANTIFLQIFPDPPSTFDMDHPMWQELFKARCISVQEFLNTYDNFELRRRIVQTTTEAQLYTCSVNPALLLINELYYFTTAVEVINSNNIDIDHLVPKLRVNGMSHVLLEHYCNEQPLEHALRSQEQVQKILKCANVVTAVLGHDNHPPQMSSVLKSCALLLYTIPDEIRSSRHVKLLFPRPNRLAQYFLRPSGYTVEAEMLKIEECLAKPERLTGAATESQNASLSGASNKSQDWSLLQRCFKGNDVLAEQFFHSPRDFDICAPDRDDASEWSSIESLSDFDTSEWEED